MKAPCGSGYGDASKGFHKREWACLSSRLLSSSSSLSFFNPSSGGGISPKQEARGAYRDKEPHPAPLWKSHSHVKESWPHGLRACWVMIEMALLALPGRTDGHSHRWTYSPDFNTPNRCFCLLSHTENKTRTSSLTTTQSAAAGQKLWSDRKSAE